MSDYGRGGSQYEHNSHRSTSRTYQNNRHHTKHLPSYEDAVNTGNQHISSHKVTNHKYSRDKENHDHRQQPQHHPDTHSFEVFDDQGIFDTSPEDVERRNNEKRSSAIAALKAIKSTEPERKSPGMSKCTICLMISFLLLVIAIMLVVTLVRW